MSKSRYKWTNTELDYLRQIVKDRYIFEIAELMSIKFNYEFRKTQIKSICNERGYCYEDQQKRKGNA